MKKKSLGINAVLNVIKQVCGILFPLIVFPYVSRVLGTTNYGKYSFTLSVMSYFLMFSRLGISTYAIREGARIREDKEKITKFINELYSINVICALLAYICFIASLFFVEKFSNYRYLLLIQSFSIILTAAGSDWVNQIYEDYSYITARYILCQILSIVPIFLLVTTNNDYYVYTIIAVFASYGGNIFNLFYLNRRIKRSFTFNLNLKKHLKPILILFSSILAIEIYVNSDITMLGFLKSESDVGIYSAISKIYSIAKQLVNAITVVTIPRISAYLSEENHDRYKTLTNNILLILIALCIPSTIGLVFLSSDIISIINGAEYLRGGTALAVLSMAFPFSLISSYFVNAILIPNRREKYAFYSTSIAALINILLNFFFIPKWGLTGAAITTLISEAYVMVSAVYYSKGVFFYKLNKSDLPKLILGNIIVFLICWLSTNIQWVYLRILVTILASVVSYVCILFFTKISASKEIVEKIRTRFPNFK